MTFHTILFSIGFLLIALAGAMIPPAILDFIYEDINWLAFAKACPLTGMIGFMLFFAYRPADKPDLTLKDTFLLTILAWIAVAFFAALPFIFSGTSVPLTNSFFEAISALTTTGATVMQGLDYASRGTLLWRSLLQWLGGVGILVMALVIWPALRVGGMQLFRNEFSDRSEKIYPKISQTAHSILTIYTALTVLCVGLLWMAGMPPFDALCHGLSTFSTGGFSTSSYSISVFDNPAIDIVLMIFMVLGAITLTLFVRALKGDIKSLYKDIQVRVFLSIIAIASLTLTLWLMYEGTPFLKALHNSTFQVISIISTTGYTLDYPLLWAPLPSVIFLILMQIGGCTGSTSGSVKIFRYLILFSVAKSQIAQLRRPHGIFLARYQGKQIPEGIFLSVFTYLALYIISLATVVVGLAFCDLDLMSSLSGAMMALSNTGVGLGPVIGPEGSLNYISDGAKWVLMVAMFIGRLEYVTLFILLSRSFWRD